MSSYTFSNGSLTTSTPIPSPADSGYFSDNRGDKLSLKKGWSTFLKNIPINDISVEYGSILNTSSKVQNGEEYFYRKLLFSLNEDSFVETNSLSVHYDYKQLEQDSIWYFNQSETLELDLQNSKRLDFLEALNARNCDSISYHILNYLPGKDLTRVVCVNKEWHNLVQKNEKLNKKRIAFLQRETCLSHSKENTPLGCHSEDKIEEMKESLCVQLCCSATKFDRFVQEGQKLNKNQNLMKCPKCEFPSKEEFGNFYTCSRNLCQYVFCKTCLQPYSSDHMCSKRRKIVPSIIIGSKQSKRNLRRL